MNWKNEASEMLENYPYVKHSVKSIQGQIKRLEMEQIALKSLQFDVVAGKGGKRSPEDKLLDNIAARQTLERTLHQAQMYIKTVDQALHALDPDDRQVLQTCYLKGEYGNMTDLALNLGLERSTVYRKRDDALRKFTLALYGIC